MTPPGLFDPAPAALTPEQRDARERDELRRREQALLVEWAAPPLRPRPAIDADLRAVRARLAALGPPPAPPEPPPRPRRPRRVKKHVDGRMAATGERD